VTDLSAIDVGVVIVTYNSAEDIAACLESVKAASSRPLSIVAVDNASHDNTAETVGSSFPDVCLLRNAENLYYAAANNQGLDRAGGRYVLLLNPDVILPVGGIDALVAFLEHDQQYAAVAPRLVGPDGRRQASLRELPGLDTLWYDLLGLSFLFPRSRVFGRWRMGYFDGLSPRDVQQPMASCLLIRRSAISAFGSFDERYPMFFNDVDWCKRVVDGGGKIRYIPEVAVRHVGGASTRQRKVRMIWMSHVAYYRYLEQYCSDPWPRRVGLWLSVPFLFTAAALRSVWWWWRRTMGC
jgi:GT2 family glycosyltransferase